MSQLLKVKNENKLTQIEFFFIRDHAREEVHDPELDFFLIYDGQHEKKNIDYFYVFLWPQMLLFIKYFPNL